MKKLIRQLERGRWVLIEKDKKNPFEEGWTLDEGLYERVEGGGWVNKKTKEFYKVKGEVYRREPTNYPFEHPKVQQHLSNGGNIGYLCGSNKIYVFDLDNKELLKEFEEIIGETLTTETKNGYHLYFEYDGELHKIIFEKNGVHLGELQGIGQQVLTPPSIHPSGKEYVVFKDLPIVKLSDDKLKLIKQKFSDKIFEIKSPDWSRYKDVSGLNINLLLQYLPPLTKYGLELLGVHPTHGSTTGKNFFVNPSKNKWHCFRHDSGGDALSLIAVLEGICNCEDFRKDGKKLRGDDFKKTLEITKDKYHFDIKSKGEYTEVKTLRPSFEIKVISAKELSTMDIPVPSWIIENLVPEEGLVIVAGKTASMKSFLSTTMGICSNYGKDFLGKFKTTKGVWLYFDEENPLRLTKDRNEKILEGLEVDAPDDFKYVCHSGIKLDNEEHLQVLEEIIDRYKPSVVVFDSLVRFLDHTDENNAGEISNIFTKLRRLTSIYKTTFLIIHHMRKSSKEKGHEDQDEGVRGSTDIVNAVDCLLLISRKDKSSPYINVKQEKNRFDKEIEPFVILIKQSEDNKGVSFEIAANTEQELSIADKAANEILTWLREEKEWEDKNNKVFKTSEVIERFNGIFNKKFDRNRKIINESLNILNLRERIKRTETKGYYLFVDMIEFDIKEEKEEDDEDGS